MANLRRRLGQASDYLRRGDVAGLLHKLIHSESTAYGIRRDLTATGPRRSASGHELRLASASDIATVLGDPAGTMDAQERSQRRIQEAVVGLLGTASCYVVDADDVGPAFMQYLFFADDNDKLQARFPGMYPRLAAHEALVEFLYVMPAARRLQFTRDCMLLVAEEARRHGATSLISYPDIGNRGVLVLLQMTGFEIDTVRHSTYRFFRKSTTFEPSSMNLRTVLAGRRTEPPQREIRSDA